VAGSCAARRRAARRGAAGCGAARRGAARRAQPDAAQPDAARRDAAGRPPARETQAQTLLASIIQSSHDAIIAVSLNMEILSWNPGAERLFGYSADEVLGRHIDLVIPTDRRADEREIIKLIATGGRFDRFRTRRRCRDGSLIPVSLAVSPLTDPGDGSIVGVATMARDVSARERVEARLGAVLDAAPDAIIAVDADGRVVLANGQAERLFDRDARDIIGCPVRSLVPEGLPPGGGPARPDRDDPVDTVDAVRRNGQSVPVEVTVSVAETPEGAVRCAVLRDVSDRLVAETERVRLRERAERDQLEARLQRTQRLESLGQLAGGIAHDFNNLVGVIANYAEFIIEEAAGRSGDGTVDAAAIAADATQIARAAGRGSDLTHQLLAFARQEAIRVRTVDLNRAIRDVEPMLRSSIGEHNTLSTRLEADLPAITVDPGQLEQVLVNLAVNARDAMPGGGLLSLETATQEVDDHYAAARPVLRPGRYVRLRVSDTGGGMSRQVIERAFEPFFTTKPTGQGTGLGLATVYGIVMRAGGDLQIYSESGLGTTINVLLPATDDLPATGAEGVVAAPPSARGETVLVAEDETALREVVVRILGGAGYRVLAADGGAAALALAQDHSGPIHLLLSDVLMPSMQGRELAGRLTDARPGTRVLFVSGYARPVLASHGALEPDVELLEKPFSRTDLLTAVRRQLDE
jgi:PAS domain S-box-containing protein